MTPTFTLRRYAGLVLRGLWEKEDQGLVNSFITITNNTSADQPAHLDRLIITTEIQGLCACYIQNFEDFSQAL